MTHEDKAEHILMNIKINSVMIRNAEHKANMDMERIKTTYAHTIELWKKNVVKLEKALEKLVKDHAEAVLKGSDRADFKSGSVMLKMERRVTKIKGMLEKLKSEGLTQAVKVAKEVVDWDVVEKFDDDTLAKLGTERLDKACFSYELKDS